MRKEVKLIEEPKLKFRTRHKILFVLFLFLFFVSLFYVGFHLFNYYKFLIGFDLTLRLSVDKNDFNLVNAQESQVEFNIENIANIFCNTECEYKFTDLSKNIILANDSFLSSKALDNKIIQKIQAPNTGEGQKVYALDIACRNIPTDVCKTKGSKIYRRTIITMEYSLSEEQLTKKKLAESPIYLATSLIFKINETLKKLVPPILENYPFLINSEDLNLITNNLNSLSILLNEILPLWTSQDYTNINLYSLDQISNEFQKNLNNFNTNLSKNVIVYNEMVEKINSLGKELENIKTYNLDQNQSKDLQEAIQLFNENILYFKNNNNNLQDKKSIFKIISSIDTSTFENQTKDSDYNFSEIKLQNLTEISLNTIGISSINFSLPETKKTCCLNNICKYCEIQKKYPIIMLHGHNFNDDISADNSINGFEDIQSRLESIGYLNAGELYLYESKRATSGILGNLLSPIVVRTSYYFDFIKKPQGYNSIQIQSQNIDTYAIRLRDIIDSLKYETQSKKVIIISHSMGGLVVRRYVQIFGKDSLDRVILINSPNHGIEGAISASCKAFGAMSECNDMDVNSLFINKINSGELVMPKTYNLVGTGCKMGEEDGDGIVLVKNGILNETKDVKNFFFNGTCSGVNFFHNSILDINQHPEVFTVIEKALRE